MTKNKENFYLAKGEDDLHPWLYYGEEPPIIRDKTSNGGVCQLIGSFCDNPIADSIKDNEIVKIYIKKETKKNK